MAQVPPVPRASHVVTGDRKVSHDWDKWFQDVAQTLNALSTTILSGPDADPNGIVIGSPGYLYRRTGAITSRLWVKESGVNTDTGWVGK